MAKTEKKSIGTDPAKELRAALTDQLGIDLRRNPVKVSMEGDVLLIEGVVEGIAEKKRALYVAMGLRGSAGVIDRLRVRPASEMTDVEIKRHFLDAVIGEPTLSGLDIVAEVSDGVVDIEGKASSLTHKRLAGVLAWWVPGSTDVINSIEVEPAEDDSDEEIEDALRIVFEKDRLVNPDSVTVSVKDWVVTLTGTVSSEPERDAAEHDAWYVWGVNDVVNRLRARTGPTV